MMEGCENFLRLLTATSGSVEVAYQNALDEWLPDQPPMTTLFAALGDQIAKDFVTADVDANRRVFLLIEQAMESSDQILITAVATGLIEALVTRAAQSDDLWGKVVLFLGPRSRHHAEAWLAK